MVQGGLHRGLAVCEGSPGLVVAQPTPGLVTDQPPSPCRPFVLAQVHDGMGIKCNGMTAFWALRRPVMSWRNGLGTS